MSDFLERHKPLLKPFSNGPRLVKTLSLLKLHQVMLHFGQILHRLCFFSGIPLTADSAQPPSPCRVASRLERGSEKCAGLKVCCWNAAKVLRLWGFILLAIRLPGVKVLEQAREVADTLLAHAETGVIAQYAYRTAVKFDYESLLELLTEMGDLGEPRTVSVKFDRDEQLDRERAVHRLLTIGVVADYTVDFSAGCFSVRLSGLDNVVVAASGRVSYKQECSY